MQMFARKQRIDACLNAKETVVCMEMKNRSLHGYMERKTRVYMKNKDYNITQMKRNSSCLNRYEKYTCLHERKEWMFA